MMQSNCFHDGLRTSQPGTVSSPSLHTREQDLFTENFGSWPVIENMPPSYTNSERVSYNQSAEPKREVEGNLRLPPGFRFVPTDEELLSYLTCKVLNSSAAFEGIGLVDFNKCEPWDLPAKAKMDEGVFYFSLRFKKYPRGMRTNRATEAGYWKATGKDREVTTESTGKLLGMKKTLVFYTGRAPKGEKTNWILHEYRLEGELGPDQQEWVVCRVVKKSVSSKKPPPDSSDNNSYNEYTRQPYSTSLLALQNSPFSNSGSSSSSANYRCAGHDTIPELPSGLQDVLRWTNNPNVSISDGVPSNGLSMRVRKDTALNETLEHMVPGNWDLLGDLYSHDAEPIWDVNAETT